MADDSAAFGIFSVSASDGADSLGPHSASTLYQSQFASGPFFVRVVNYTGSAGASKRSEQMASVIRARTGTSAFQLPEVLRKFQGEAGRVRYVRGPLGIQNGGLDEWSDPLEGLEPYSGYLVSAGQTGRIVLLQFTTPAASEEFLRGRIGRRRRGRASGSTPPHRSSWWTDPKSCARRSSRIRNDIARSVLDGFDEECVVGFLLGHPQHHQSEFPRVIVPPHR